MVLLEATVSFYARVQNIFQDTNTEILLFLLLHRIRGHGAIGAVGTTTRIMLMAIWHDDEGRTNERITPTNGSKDETLCCCCYRK